MKLIGLLLCCFTCHAMANVVVRDDSGKVFTFTKPAQRIISLSPGITEMLFAAGGAGRIVGVMDYSDYPQAAKRIPVIGDSRALDMERILSLDPDLLVVWREGSSARQIEQLKKSGIPLFFNDEHKLGDIPKNIERLGQLMGTEIQANQSAETLRQQLTMLNKKYAGAAKVDVFYQVWNKPLLTLNGQHIVSDAIQICGGVNIFSDLISKAPNVSIEAVLQKNPEVIISTTEAAQTLQTWRRYSTMTAVRRNNLFTIDGDLLSRAGPRMIDGVAALCEKLDQARRKRADNIHRTYAKPPQRRCSS